VEEYDTSVGGTMRTAICVKPFDGSDRVLATSSIVYKKNQHKQPLYKHNPKTRLQFFAETNQTQSNPTPLK
jgi:hypothetical protein